MQESKVAALGKVVHAGPATMRVEWTAGDMVTLEANRPTVLDTPGHRHFLQLIAVAVLLTGLPQPVARE